MPSCCPVSLHPALLPCPLAALPAGRRPTHGSQSACEPRCLASKRPRKGDEFPASLSGCPAWLPCYRWLPACGQPAWQRRRLAGTMLLDNAKEGCKRRQWQGVVYQGDQSSILECYAKNKEECFAMLRLVANWLLLLLPGSRVIPSRCLGIK